MDITEYVDRLRQQFETRAEVFGGEADELTEKLLEPLAASIQLTLLDALSEAAEEISGEMAPDYVELRIRQGQLGFAVTRTDSAPLPQSQTAPPALPIDEGETARLNLRMSDKFKTRLEEAARTDGLSLNAWLLQAAASRLSQSGSRSASTTSHNGPQRFTGWVN
ncbi:hypothetical protein [Natronoglycomyces albus]|uniref:Toxin-antitoxin system HicB family antitoxin n=1 Tax=Natronoglycomyces albus TaxID=2811108 RepID=A0A895XQT8_9ACTN|nr:hypothetical protein [Natronoglycomyces albus]QSB05525.1 hypothetical protein JQS30_00860 [Natronoglycomyces albus]